jgi:hypothetical protein
MGKDVTLISPIIANFGGLFGADIAMDFKISREPEISKVHFAGNGPMLKRSGNGCPE